MQDSKRLRVGQQLACIEVKAVQVAPVLLPDALDQLLDGVCACLVQLEQREGARLGVLPGVPTSLQFLPLLTSPVCIRFFKPLTSRQPIAKGHRAFTKAGTPQVLSKEYGFPHREVPITRAPAWDSRYAEAFPMPVLVPVIRKTLPVTSAVMRKGLSLGVTQ